MAEDGVFDFHLTSKTGLRDTDDAKDDVRTFDLRISDMFKQASLDPLTLDADTGAMPDTDSAVLADYVPGDEFWF